MFWDLPLYDILDEPFTMLYFSKSANVSAISAILTHNVCSWLSVKLGGTLRSYKPQSKLDENGAMLERYSCRVRSTLIRMHKWIQGMSSRDLEHCSTHSLVVHGCLHLANIRHETRLLVRESSAYPQSGSIPSAWLCQDALVDIEELVRRGRKYQAS